MTERDHERAMERHWDAVADCEYLAKRSLAADLVDAELGAFGLELCPDDRDVAIEQIVEAGIETHHEEVGNGFVAHHEVALSAREALRHLRYTVRRVRSLVPRSPRAVRRPSRRSPRGHRRVVRATARAPGRPADADPHRARKDPHAPRSERPGW
jgi:hypothetical protein